MTSHDRTKHREDLGDIYLSQRKLVSGYTAPQLKLLANVPLVNNR